MMYSTHCIYGYMISDIWYLYNSPDNCDVNQYMFVQHNYKKSCSPKYTDNKTKRKEGNVLFNDALNTFLIQLYGV